MKVRVINLDVQQYKGQILGTDTNGDTVLIKADVNGNLLLSPLPSGVNDIGQTLNGFMENVVLASATRTVSGNSAEFDCSNYKEAVVFLDVTLASGTTPTLDVKFQTQDPISLKWFDFAELTFTQAITTTTEMKTKANLIGKKLRCVYDITGGTPSFDFSVGLVLKS